MASLGHFELSSRTLLGMVLPDDTYGPDKKKSPFDSFLVLDSMKTTVSIKIWSVLEIRILNYLNNSFRS